MDFIEGLPMSKGYNVIIVIVDRFSKYNHYIPMAHPYTAATVAKAFMENIFKLHGIPQSIVSDQDKIFTSNF
jgi:protoheme ferro-lyase